MPSLLEPDRAVCSSVEVSEEGPFFYESVKLALNGVEYGEPQFLRFYDQPSLFLEILPVTGGNPSPSPSPNPYPKTPTPKP